MFDFMRWCRFIHESAEALNGEGFSTKLRLSDHSPKPGTALDVSGRKTLASFANWNTGETDWEIMDMNGKRILGKWGLLLNDDSFQTAFHEFAKELRVEDRK